MMATRYFPVVESMAALVVLDAWAVQERLRPDWQSEQEPKT